MSQTPFKKLDAEREARLLDYIKQNMTAEEIGEREGWETYYALNKRNALARKHGLPVPSKPQQNKRTPYGLTTDTVQLRLELGNRLANWQQDTKRHHLEVARDVGIGMRDQTLATVQSHNSFNWKLSNIERLAKQLGMSSTKLLLLGLQKDLEARAKAENTTVDKLVMKMIYGERNGNGRNSRRG